MNKNFNYFLLIYWFDFLIIFKILDQLFGWNLNIIDEDEIMKQENKEEYINQLLINNNNKNKDEKNEE